MKCLVCACVWFLNICLTIETNFFLGTWRCGDDVWPNFPYTPQTIWSNEMFDLQLHKVQIIIVRFSVFLLHSTHLLVCVCVCGDSSCNCDARLSIVVQSIKIWLSYFLARVCVRACFSISFYFSPSRSTVTIHDPFIIDTMTEKTLSDLCQIYIKANSFFCIPWFVAVFFYFPPSSSASSAIWIFVIVVRLLLFGVVRIQFRFFHTLWL